MSVPPICSFTILITPESLPTKLMSSPSASYATATDPLHCPSIFSRPRFRRVSNQSTASEPLPSNSSLLNVVVPKKTGGLSFKLLTATLMACSTSNSPSVTWTVKS